MPDDTTTDQPPASRVEMIPARTWIRSAITGNWVFHTDAPGHDLAPIAWRHDGTHNVTNPNQWTIQTEAPWNTGHILQSGDSIRLTGTDTETDAALRYAIGADDHTDTLHNAITHPDETPRLTSPRRLIPRLLATAAIITILFTPILGDLAYPLIATWILGDILGNIWRPHLEAFATRHTHHNPDTCERTHE